MFSNKSIAIMVVAVLAYSMVGTALMPLVAQQYANTYAYAAENEDDAYVPDTAVTDDGKDEASETGESLEADVKEETETLCTTEEAGATENKDEVETVPETETESAASDETKAEDDIEDIDTTEAEETIEEETKTDETVETLPSESESESEVENEESTADDSDTYKVTFDLNDGTGELYYGPSITVKKDERLQYRLPKNVTNKSGFLYWAYDKEGLNAIPSDWDYLYKLDFVDGNSMKLYAIYKENEGSLPETKPEETKPEETTPEETKPEETIPETKPEETIPETTPEETVPETVPETTPEETTPSRGGSSVIGHGYKVIEVRGEDRVDELPQISETSMVKEEDASESTLAQAIETRGGERHVQTGDASTMALNGFLFLLGLTTLAGWTVKKIR